MALKTKRHKKQITKHHNNNIKVNVRVGGGGTSSGGGHFAVPGAPIISTERYQPINPPNVPPHHGRRLNENAPLQLPDLHSQVGVNANGDPINAEGFAIGDRMPDRSLEALANSAGILFRRFTEPRPVPLSQQPEPSNNSVAIGSSRASSLSSYPQSAASSRAPSVNSVAPGSSRSSLSSYPQPEVSSRAPSAVRHTTPSTGLPPGNYVRPRRFRDEVPMNTRRINSRFGAADPSADQSPPRIGRPPLDVQYARLREELSSTLTKRP